MYSAYTDPFYEAVLRLRLAAHERIQALKNGPDRIEKQRDWHLGEARRLKRQIKAASAARDDHEADAARLDQQLKARDRSHTESRQAEIDAWRRKDAAICKSGFAFYQKGILGPLLLSGVTPPFDDTDRAADEARQRAEDRRVAEDVQRKLGDQYTVEAPDKARRGADGRLFLTVERQCEPPVSSARKARVEREMAYRGSLHAAIVRGNLEIQLLALWDLWDAEREQRRKQELELGLEPFDPGERPAHLPKLTYRGKPPPTVETDTSFFGGGDDPPGP